MTWTGKVWKFGEAPDDVMMNALQADITAKANADSGAPQVQTAAFAGLAVTTGKLAASAASQAKMKTSQGEVTLNAFSDITGGVELPGGEYGFYTETKRVSILLTARIAWYTDFEVTVTTSYSTRIAGSDGNARQRYITGSPPYDIGNGECHLFIFLLIERATGNIVGGYCAPEAPWHYNGPTKVMPIARSLDDMTDDEKSAFLNMQSVRQKIRSGGEITDDDLAAIQAGTALYPKVRTDYLHDVSQEVKNADMPIHPHPFAVSKPDDYRVVLLDPTSDLTRELLDLHNEGMSILSMINQGFFKISESTMSVYSPPGVDTVSYRWI